MTSKTGMETVVDNPKDRILQITRNKIKYIPKAYTCVSEWILTLISGVNTGEHGLSPASLFGNQILLAMCMSLCMQIWQRIFHCFWTFTWPLTYRDNIKAKLGVVLVNVIVFCDGIWIMNGSLMLVPKEQKIIQTSQWYSKSQLIVITQ